MESVLSRANKSVRLFDHVASCLADGRQPSMESLVDVGYLMRTTAVYGNGKFGLADLPHTFDSGLFSRPFEAEMLTVYLIREFTIDLVEHIARARSPEHATTLAPHLACALGIGNSTGLGMAPFLTAHPTLIHHWIGARESAIARVKDQPCATEQKRRRFLALLPRAIAHVAEWHTKDPRQAARTKRLQTELVELCDHLHADGDMLRGQYPWRRLSEWALQNTSEELQELLNSLMVEIYGELVDELADTMTDPEAPRFNPAMRLGQLRELIEEHYAWALAIDFGQPAANHFFWYRSAEKEEPRLGERYSENGAALEMRVGVARDVKRLHQVLSDPRTDSNEGLAVFLLRHPQWRHVSRRVQTIAAHPYGEIHDNLLDAECLPVDILRCKLSFFGAIKFDPKSDRWTRITMYQGAPRFSALEPNVADAWFLPVFVTEQSELHA